MKNIRYFIRTLNQIRSQNRKFKLIVAYKLCNIPVQKLDKYDAKTFPQPFVSYFYINDIPRRVFEFSIRFFLYDFIHTCEAQFSKYFIHYRTQTL